MRIVLALIVLALCLTLADDARAAYAPVSTCHAGARSTGGTAITTAAVNCTGADLLVLTISNYTGAGASSAPSDSSTNAWQVAVAKVAANTVTTIYFVHAPTVSSSQTFTASASGGKTFPAIEVQGFSGSASSPLDQTSSAVSANSCNCRPGPVTPSQSNELVVTAVGNFTVPSMLVIDSGFTITDMSTYRYNNNEGGGLAYFIQTTAASVNPLWTISGPSVEDFLTAVIASFK